MSQELASFEGRNEVASTIKIMRAGDGLSTPLAAEPRGWAQGDRLPVLLWTTVGKITHEPATEGKGVVRLHILNTDEAAVLDHVDEALLDDLLASQRERVAEYEATIAAEKEAAKGIQKLAVDPDPDGQPMTDAEWMGEAAMTPPTPIGKRRKKAKDAE